MHLTDDAVSELARLLFDARMGLRDADLPLTPMLTEADGYRVGWLAAAPGRNERELTAGQIVMSGSFGAPLPVEPSDDIHIEFGHLGHLQLKGTTR